MLTQNKTVVSKISIIVFKINIIFEELFYSSLKANPSTVCHALQFENDGD